MDRKAFKKQYVGLGRWRQADIERTVALVSPQVRLGRRSEGYGVGNVFVEEVELDLGTDGIVDEYLVASVVDVLLLEIDAELP